MSSRSKISDGFAQSYSDSLSIDCHTVTSNLDSIPLTVELDFKNSQIHCQYHHGTILVFPICDLHEMQTYHRSVSELYQLNQLKRRLHRCLASVFEVEIPRNQGFSSALKEDDILLLRFSENHELALSFDSNEQLISFQHKLKQLILQKPKTDLTDSCINVCVGQQSKIGLLSRIFCINRPINSMPVVPFQNT